MVKYDLINNSINLIFEGRGNTICFAKWVKNLKWRETMISCVAFICKFQIFMYNYVHKF